MSIERILEKMPAVPRSGFLKVSALLQEHDSILALEKTASTSSTLIHKEQELLDLFYKEAAAGFGKALGRVARSVFDPKASAALHMAQSGVGHQAARQAVQNPLTRLTTTAKGAGNVISKYPAESLLSAGAAGMVYRNTFGKDAEELDLKEKTAAVLVSGGYELLKLSGHVSDRKVESLKKLAAVGVINAKLQIATQDPACPGEYRDQLFKLGQENNRHCISLLKELVKESEDVLGMGATAGRGAVSGFFGAIGDKVNAAAGAAKNGLRSNLGKDISKGMNTAINSGGTGVAPATSTMGGKK